MRYIAFRTTHIWIAVLYMPTIWGGCPEPCQCTGPGDLSVDCSYKQLTALPDGLQYNITSLNLSGNLITAIESDMFEGFSSLTELYLSNNLISDLSNSSFRGLTSLSSLYLNANNISILPNQVFIPLGETLNYLDLSQNNLHQLPPRLDECNFLEQLLLRANLFTSDIFDRLNTVISLKNLDLSENPIKELPYLSFANMVQLQFLKLEEAEISKIDNNAFARASELKYLHMSGNNLKSVNREMLQPLYQLQELDISENHLICECATKQLQDLVKENKIRLQNAAKCLLEDGSHTYLDIGADDLDFLCQGHGPTEPPPVNQCDNVTLEVYNDILADGDEVILSWNYTASLIPTQIIITYRPFGSDMLRQEVRPGNTSSYDLADLDSGTSYIACVVMQECDLKSCTEFTTFEEPQSSMCPIFLAVGLTVAAFLLIFLVILLVKFALMWKKHGKNVLKNFKKGQLTKSYTPNGSLPRTQTIVREPQSTQIPVPNQRVSTTARSEHPYEAIPADALNGFTNLGYLPSDNSDGGLDQQIPTVSDTVNNNTLTSVTDEYLTPVPSTPSDTPQISSRQCACSFVELQADHHQWSSSRPSVYHKYEEPKDVSLGPHSLPSTSGSLLAQDQPPRRQHSLDRSFRRAQSEGFAFGNPRMAYGTMPRGQGRKRPLPGCSCGNHFCRTLSRPLPATPVTFTPQILNHMKPVVSVESPVDTIEHTEPHMRWQSSLHLSTMSECEV